MGALEGGAEGEATMAGFLFDKNRLLIRYKAALSTSTVTSLVSKGSTREITSEDARTYT